MNNIDELKSLSDDELLHRVSDLLAQSRRVEWVLVAHIAEVDARRLYAREASPSMIHYCMDVLHLSEGEAYRRIAAARLSSYANWKGFLQEMVARGLREPLLIVTDGNPGVLKAITQVSGDPYDARGRTPSLVRYRSAVQTPE